MSKNCRETVFPMAAECRHLMSNYLAESPEEINTTGFETLPAQSVELVYGAPNVS